MRLNFYLQKYAETVARLDARVPETPIFLFTEGNELTFFTGFFK